MNKVGLGYKSINKSIDTVVERKVDENLKSIVYGNTKEIEAEDFIISCLKKYATSKTFPPKQVYNATVAPFQATFPKSNIRIAKIPYPD